MASARGLMEEGLRSVRRALRRQDRRAGFRRHLAQILGCTDANMRVDAAFRHNACSENTYLSTNALPYASKDLIVRALDPLRTR